MRVCVATGNGTNRKENGRRSTAVAANRGKSRLRVVDNFPKWPMENETERSVQTTKTRKLENDWCCAV